MGIVVFLMGVADLVAAWLLLANAAAIGWGWLTTVVAAILILKGLSSLIGIFS